MSDLVGEPVMFVALSGFGSFEVGFGGK
jgi:hypothetical protein